MKNPKYIIICNSKYKVVKALPKGYLLVKRVLICLPRFIPELEYKQPHFQLKYPVQNKFLRIIELF